MTTTFKVRQPPARAFPRGQPIVRVEEDAEALRAKLGIVPINTSAITPVVANPLGAALVAVGCPVIDERAISSHKIKVERRARRKHNTLLADIEFAVQQGPWFAPFASQLGVLAAVVYLGFAAAYKLGIVTVESWIGSFLTLTSVLVLIWVGMYQFRSWKFSRPGTIPLLRLRASETPLLTWKTCPLKEFSGRIPAGILQMVEDLTPHLPKDAVFSVDFVQTRFLDVDQEISRARSGKGIIASFLELFSDDPFLRVSTKTESYGVAAWDEQGFQVTYKPALAQSPAAT